MARVTVPSLASTDPPVKAMEAPDGAHEGRLRCRRTRASFPRASERVGANPLRDGDIAQLGNQRTTRRRRIDRDANPHAGHQQAHGGGHMGQA